MNTVSGTYNSEPEVLIQQTSPWYALRVRAKRERTVDRVLGPSGYEHYLPLYTTETRWSDRVVRSQRVLFPDYVFCRFDLAHRRNVLATPGAAHGLRFS